MLVIVHCLRYNLWSLHGVLVAGSVVVSVIYFFWYFLFNSYILVVYEWSSDCYIQGVPGLLYLC
jgi:hypothetical protein